LAEKVLTILQSPDSRYIENELVPLLDYERFDFVKLLVRNRKKITFCTRLGKAQSDEERKQIEAEMQVTF
jgi:pre-mRNA-splicing helicase BRR2